MKNTMKTLMSAVAGLGFLTSMTLEASACGGRGGGGGWGGGYRQSYHYNNYQPNCYQQYPQQQFPPQQFPQQQFPQQQIPQQQFSQQQVPQGQMQQQVPQQQLQQQVVPQGQTQAVPQGQGAPVAQNVAGPQTRVVAKPVSSGGASFVGSNTAAPVAAAPQQAPTQSAQGSAEMSALQALSGWDGSDQPAADAQATAQATFNPTGEFVATLANGATVRLRMMDDSTFTWIATNKGKNSSFQGSYSIEGGSLKLLRSSDNQKLEGSFGQTQNGFNFKLGSGQAETSMSFVRG